MLQGATNGTIGPQQGDATVVQGVNTAGTVRVNNLANLEAMMATDEVFGALASAEATATCSNNLKQMTLASIGFSEQPMPQTREHVLLARQVGVPATGGLATPGVINWLVASARDANLFS